MSDIGFEGAANLLGMIIVTALVMFIVPGLIWLWARRGGNVSRKILVPAKVLTVLSSILIFVIVLGFLKMIPG